MYSGLKVTDQVGSIQQYLSLEIVEPVDWEGGNSRQRVKAAKIQPQLEQINETVVETHKVTDSQQSFPLKVVQQFDWGEGNSQQPVKAVTDQRECPQWSQLERYRYSRQQSALFLT
jgi:hypothetical protein